MAVKNETNIDNLRINYLTESEYNAALEAGEIIENEIYMTPTEQFVEYVHPDSGVTPGTYKSVTVNAQGHVTAGTNPETLEEYGIIDAATIAQGIKADSAVQSVKIGDTEYKSGTTVNLPEYPSKLSDLDNDTGFSVITVDSSLSDTSTNPVQNNVIKAKFDSIEDEIAAIPEYDTTYDLAASTSSSNGNVTLNLKSGGTSSVAQKTDSISIIGTGATTVTTNSSGTVEIKSADTTYPVASSSTDGLMSSSDKEKLDTIELNANNYTLPVAGSDIGGVKSGADITVDSSGNVSVNNDSHTHGATTITSVDASVIQGTISEINLPSYVDDVVEYTTSSNFPSTGESGKIYVDTTTNLTYRWSGSGYVEISPSIALGETSSTAYRGDRGAAAYAHAVTNKGSAFNSGLYKITTNSEGHVTDAADVSKSDIASLGITASVTATTSGDGAAYIATVEGIDSLTVGATFIMIPHTVSTSTSPTLDVNSLGAKTIRQPLSNSTSSTTSAASTNWLGSGKPVKVTYNGTFWVAELVRPNASTIYGTVAIANGGTGANNADDALTNLGAMPAAQTMTTAEYNALETKSSTTLYMLTDDTTEEDMQAQIDGLQAEIENIETLPSYTAADEGKFLRIADNVAAWVSIENAEEVSF